MTKRLQITVVSAKGLPAKDLNGYSDPYVIAQIGSQKHKTKTVWKNLNPSWNDTFVLGVTDPNLEELTCYVYDADLLSSDDLIGFASTTLRSLPQGVDKDILLKLNTKGEVLLRLKALDFGVHEGASQFQQQYPQQQQQQSLQQQYPPQHQQYQYPPQQQQQQYPPQQQYQAPAQQYAPQQQQQYPQYAPQQTTFAPPQQQQFAPQQQHQYPPQQQQPQYPPQQQYYAPPQQQYPPTALVGCTWDRASSHPSFKFSNNDLTLNGTTMKVSAVATRGISSGMAYWEIHNDKDGDVSSVGIVHKDKFLSSKGIGHNGYAYDLDGEIIVHNESYEANVPSCNEDGQVIGVLVDMNRRTVSYFVNGVWYKDVFTKIPNTVYPAVTIHKGQCTANFHAQMPPLH